MYNSHDLFNRKLQAARSNTIPFRLDRGVKATQEQISIAYALVAIRLDTPQFFEMLSNYDYDRKFDQICSLCASRVHVSAAQVMRKISLAWLSDLTICDFCSPKNINESTIIRACEIVLNTTFARNTRPIKIGRDDYPYFFHGSKMSSASLELDAIEISASDSDLGRKMLIIEIDGEHHFYEKSGWKRDVQRTKMADSIKNVLVPRLFPRHQLVRVPINGNDDISKNLERAYVQLVAAGFAISRTEWSAAIAKIADVASPYRKKIIENVSKSGATFRTQPKFITQKTVLELFCENGSNWNAHASIFAAATACCSCFYCSQRRPLTHFEIDEISARANISVVTEKSHYAANDKVETKCRSCNNVLKDQLKVRKIREKARENSSFYCRYCNMKAAIAAISAYLDLQKTKMSEKDARAKIIADFGVNPASIWQSFRNDYRDDKLTQACKSLLETAFPDQLEKKKRGNKFSDEQLVSFLERLHDKTPMSADDMLQSKESTIKRFRKQKADGTLLPALEKRILALNICLEPKDNFSTEERLAQLKSFEATHHRLPKENEFELKRKAGDADGGLYHWQRDKFFQLRHGLISDQTLISELTEIQTALKTRLTQLK